MTTLPHSREAEEAVLGGLLLAPDRWPDVAELVQEGDFFIAAHRALFAEIARQAANGEAPDAVTLADCKTVDSELVIALAAGATGAANITTYARIVSDRARRRNLLRIAGDLQERAAGAEELQVVLDWAGQEILAVDAPRSGGPRGTDVIAREWVARQSERETGLTGLKTGFVDFDAATHGLHPGELLYLAARPGMGKTSLGLDIARQVASQGHSVLIFSLEMPAVDLFDRLVAQRGRVDLQALRGGRLSAEESERTSAAAAELVRLSIKIDDTPALTTTAVRARARRHKQKHGLDLLVIDYLGLIRGPGENRTREIGNISRDLKAIAKELSIPVLCLAQLNRNLEQRADPRPKLSDLRDSGDIEQDADLVAFIYRDDVYHEGSPDKGLAELSIAKQRQGPCKTILLTFQAESTGFSNVDHASQHGWAARKGQRNARGIYDDL